MLRGWASWVQSVDPTLLNTFQVRDTLGYVAKRCEALKIDAGARVPAADVSQGWWGDAIHRLG